MLFLPSLQSPAVVRNFKCREPKIRGKIIFWTWKNTKKYFSYLPCSPLQSPVVVRDFKCREPKLRVKLFFGLRKIKKKCFS